MRWDGPQNPLGGKVLRQKPHVRFLEAFPVRAVGRRSSRPVQTSDTAPIGAELRLHDEKKTESPSGSVGRCRMIRGGRNSHPWPSCVPKAAQARRIKDYGIGSNPLSTRDLASADYSQTTGGRMSFLTTRLSLPRSEVGYLLAAAISRARAPPRTFVIA